MNFFNGARASFRGSSFRGVRASIFSRQPAEIRDFDVPGSACKPIVIGIQGDSYSHFSESGVRASSQASY